MKEKNDKLNRSHHITHFTFRMFNVQRSLFTVHGIHFRMFTFQIHLEISSVYIVCLSINHSICTSTIVLFTCQTDITRAYDDGAG